MTLRKGELIEWNLKLLEAIERSNDNALKQEALTVLKSTVDSYTTSFLEKNGTQIPPDWNIHQITSTFLEGNSNNLSYAIEVFKDLQGTPTSTSWFLNEVVAFINLIVGGGY